MTRQPDELNALDQATRTRLARLSSVPVDTAALSQRVRRAMETQAPRRVRPLKLWWPAFSAAAAVLTLAVGLMVLLMGSAPAVAQTADLAQLHHQVMAGQVQAQQVRDVTEANRVLAALGRDMPAFPATPQTGQVMACCAGKLCGRPVATLVLEYEHARVSLTVAKRDEMTCRGDGTITHQGRTYCVGQAGDLNMVMEERAGRWLCVTGDLPREQLLTLIAALSF